MRSPFHPSTPRKLSDTLQHRLNMYALAAGAGMLAAAQPAAAEVVYTPTHQQIGDNQTVALDLNNDGKTDFKIHQTWTCTSFCEYIVGALKALPARSQNEVLGHVGRYYDYASALAAGIHIGPHKKNFAAGKRVLGAGGYDAGTTSVGWCFGDWVNLKHHYLGLRFVIGGKVHFGWARLNETCGVNGDNTAVLTGYAYETVVNQPIVAGDTGMAGNAARPADRSLSRLARGSASDLRGN